MQIIINEIDWIDSKYRTKEWEQSVKITRWEHNHLTKKYIIDYKEYNIGRCVHFDINNDYIELPK